MSNNFNNLQMSPIVDALLDNDLREGNYGPTVLLRVLFLNYLRASFFGRDPEDEFAWNVDPLKSKVGIHDSAPEETEVKEKKPLIILSRGPIVPMNMGINNGMVFYDVNSDTTRSMDLLTTSLEFKCICVNLLESERLAGIVYGILRYFKSDLLARGVAFINQFQITPPRHNPAFDASTIYTGVETSVTCAVGIYDNWKLRWKTDIELAEYLRRTGLEMRGNKIPPRTITDFTSTITLNATGDDV